MALAEAESLRLWRTGLRPSYTDRKGRDTTAALQHLAGPGGLRACPTSNPSQARPAHRQEAKGSGDEESVVSNSYLPQGLGTHRDHQERVGEAGS